MVATVVLGTWLLTAQEPAGPRESWSEWLMVRNEVPHPHSSAGWLRPPDAYEFRTEDSIPSFFIEDRPVVNERLVLRRGAVIEAWDLGKKALAWKLASSTGLLGWTLHGNRVASLLPGGPASRAGVVGGDLVTGFNGTALKAGDSVPGGVRAGDKVELELTSAGGIRRTAIVAGTAPEPFGDPPKFAAVLDGDLLIERDGRVERLRMADGKLLWWHRGQFVVAGGGLVLLQAEREFAVEAAGGAVRWQADLPARGHIQQSVWTTLGPVLLSGHPEFRVDRLDAATGRSAWTYVRDHSHEGHLWVYPCGRIFISAADGDCHRWGGMGGVPTHEGPTCRTYALLDLESGRQVWSQRTGGRRHGGSHRMEAPKYIPFDPHLGGPATAWGDRLLWFDLDRAELSVLDPATLKETLRLEIRGADRYSSLCPKGTIGLNTDRGLVWLDPSSGKTTRLGTLSESYGEPALAGRFVLTAVGEPNSDRPGFRALDASSGEPKVAWEVALPKHVGFNLTVEGPRVLWAVDLHMSDAYGYSLRDTVTGKEIWSVKLDSPSFWYTRGIGRGARGMTLVDPYLVLATTFGVHVYRRDHVRRDD